MAIETILEERERAEEVEANNLAEILVSEGALASVTGAELDSWPTALITIDDRPVTFRRMTWSRCWVAVARHGNHVTSLEAQGVELSEVSLSTVTDLSAYTDAGV